MPDSPRPDPAASERSTRGRGRRVLIVDDDPLNRKLATLRLTQAGFVVDTASTAEAALEMVSGAPPDAILSDVQMPGMDGFELRRALRQNARFADIPIVLMSSALADDRDRRGEADTTLRCVTRTPDLREAIDAIASALDPPRP